MNSAKPSSPRFLTRWALQIDKSYDLRYYYVICYHTPIPHQRSTVNPDAMDSITPLHLKVRSPSKHTRIHGLLNNGKSLAVGRAPSCPGPCGYFTFGCIPKLEATGGIQCSSSPSSCPSSVSSVGTSPMSSLTNLKSSDPSSCECASHGWTRPCSTKTQHVPKPEEVRAKSQSKCTPLGLIKIR